MSTVTHRPAPPTPAVQKIKKMKAASSTGSPIVNTILSILVGVGVLTFAELAARNEWVSPLVLPAPSDVGRALYDGLTRGDYPDAMIATMSAAGLGLIIAIVAAIAIAACLTIWPRVERIMMPYIVSFEALPKVAVAPLLILWLGFGAQGKITIVVIVCFYPLFVNALEGFRVQETEHSQLMQSLGASRWQTFRYLKFPFAVPYLWAGTKVAVIFALIGAVVAELVGSRSGLGYIMVREQARFNLPGVFAIMFLMLVVGLLIHFLREFVQRHSGYWGRRGLEETKQ